MNNAVYGKTMENLRNRIDVRLINNKQDYFKGTSKPISMSHKMSDNNLVVIPKSIVTLLQNFINKNATKLLQSYYRDYTYNIY